MGLEYNDHQDTIMRLDGTICMYDKEPYYITVAGTKNTVHLHDLSAGNKHIKTVKYTEDTFSYKPFPLGYLNIEDKAYFMARSPDRRQKQGLCHNLIRFANTPPRGTWFATSEMKKCIKGEYPSIDEVKEAIFTGRSNKLAFHRFCALERINSTNLGLLFRNRLIGKITQHQSRFDVFEGPETSFLYRVLPKYGVTL